MHKCYRTIDRPQILFGLEPEDAALILLLSGLGCLLFEPYIPGIVGIASWIMLVKFKQGKPFGYVMHWLYVRGFDLPGLVPSPRRTKQYGAYANTSI